MYGWTNIRNHPLINIIITCTEGPFFLRAIDCSRHRKDTDFQFHILRDAIEEVGPQNVVQVVTDATLICRAAGRLVERLPTYLVDSMLCACHEQYTKGHGKDSLD